MTSFTFDEYDNPLCPLEHVAWKYVGDRDEHRTPIKRVCGEEVMLYVVHSVHIEPGQTIDPRRAGMDAVSSSWKVECMAGHVFRAKEAAKQVFIDWLEGDGFQEGAHGASQVIDVVWGAGTADAWEKEWREKRVTD